MYHNGDVLYTAHTLPSTLQARRTDHLTYLFVPQFAAGLAFCSSMLDTLLYQVLRDFLPALYRPYITL